MKRFNDRQQRRHYILMAIEASGQSASTVQAIAKWLRRLGYRCDDYEIALELGWLEHQGCVIFNEIPSLRERHMVLMTPAGFAVLHPRRNLCISTRQNAA